MLMLRSAIRVLDPDTYANGDPATYGLPLDQYDYLREQEPVFLQKFEDPLLIDHVWVLSRHEDISAVDRDQQTWAADRGYVFIWKVAPCGGEFGKPAMLVMDGDDHRRNRGVVSRAFTPKRVQQLEVTFRDYARKVIDHALEHDGPFDFVSEIAHVMPMRALGEVLGVPEHDRGRFFAWVDTFAAPFDERITPSFELVAQAIQDLWRYALELAEIRRGDPGDDVMSKIVQAAGADTLSEEEVMGNVALLASGAAESTRTALSHGVHQLMREPDQMAWLRDRADDVPATVAQEFVRIATPFTHLVRTATRDVELHGREIKEGENVAMLFAAGNFDPEAFDDPRRFDLARDPNPHLSFGRGSHSCLGKHIAALEIKVLMEELLQRTKSIRPAGEISYIRDAVSRGVYALPITMERA